MSIVRTLLEACLQRILGDYIIHNNVR